MRTYGRIKNADGTLTWYKVETSVTGDNSLVWLVTFCQVLKLFLNESPFWSNYGIPAKQDVLQQIFPSFYVTRTQQQFSQYFTSIIVYQQNSPDPEYVINITTLSGEKIELTMGVPQ